MLETKSTKLNDGIIIIIIHQLTTIRTMMNEIEFRLCDTDYDDEIVEYGDYYSYQGELYIKQFPKMWATSHVPETGPAECENCNFYGSWNGVFIGYCMNCAEYVYEYQRGHGFIEHGEEVNNEDIPQLRAMDTYLYGVELDEIKTSIPNRDFYELSESEDSEDDVDRYLDKLKEHKKTNMRSDEPYVRRTPVSNNSCSMCDIGK